MIYERKFSSLSSSRLRTGGFCRRARLDQALLVMVLVVAGICVGCAPPIGVRKISDKNWFARENRSALDSSAVSERTRQFLRREGLSEKILHIDRLALLKKIDQRLLEKRERDTAFHLAELVYLEGSKHPADSERAVKYYLSAVQYAYAFLFDEALGAPPSRYDPLFRWACDLYNRSLGKVAAYIAKRQLLRDKRERLPLLFGEVALLEGPHELRWDPQQFDEFLVAYQYEVTGFPGTTRSYGIGVPMIASRTPKDVQRRASADRFLPKLQQTYPVTAILRFQGSITNRPADGVRHAVAELYDPLSVQTLQFGNDTIPLESDLTTPLAYMLQHTPRISGLEAMINVGAYAGRSGLYMLAPYDPEKIPVVFVHGLMSSPETWIPMFNDLLADPVLRTEYQFWFFMYPTGNPVIYSASVLRQSLLAVQQAYDPDGTNPAFNQMVICGHSMGGLLSKLQVHSSGDRLWNLISDKPIDEIDFTDEERMLLKRVFYFDALSFIERIIFMATPHRGSELATGFIGKLGASLVKLPAQISSVASAVRTKVLAKVGDANRFSTAESAISGVGNLAPDNAMQKEIVTWSYPPHLPIHSVIGNYRAADTPGGSDRIVPYTSSHLDDVVSELIVKSDHSVHNHPLAIVEVRRILHQHLEAATYVK